MSTACTKLDLETLRVLLEKATPGKWSVVEDGSGRRSALTANGQESLLGLDVDGMAIVWREEDAALIVAMKNLLPRLLDAAGRVAR